MRKTLSVLGLIVAAAQPAAAQNPDRITLYEYPAFFGRSVTITAATPDLATQNFARKARSARVVGSWTACTAAQFAGTCQTLTADQNQLFLVGLDKSIASLRPTNPAPAAATGSATMTGTTTGTAAGTTPGTATAATTAGVGAAVAADRVVLANLDVDAGAQGQDTEFFAQPSLGKIQVSAGTNDKTAGDAFCRQAGYTSAAYAARGRVQASGLVDLATSAKVRAFPLRDVLCRR